MVNIKYQINHTDNENRENLLLTYLKVFIVSLTCLIVSLTCLLAPIWIPILWWLTFPFSGNEGIIKLGMILMVCLPFFPFFILKDGKIIYLILLLIAIPFLVAIAFVVGWAVVGDRYGP